MTVILTLPSMVGSITAPKMMFASACAASWMIVVAWLTSIMDRSDPPVMLMMTPRAPSTRASSISGLAMARLAASTLRSLPSPKPVPMMAMPMPDMMVFTSAKSRLIMPGTRMRSEMPRMAWCRTSSASRNASVRVVVCSMCPSRRSLGMAMTESTDARSSSSPRLACSARRLPSNLNGLVTTAIVNAPSSLARAATTGAAPVPVPPPRPAVTKTMSAPPSALMSCSVSSRAACRPTLGSAPAPRPPVTFNPICRRTGASFCASACASVLATMKSTPRTPAATIRPTALLPPPPTPTTLIRAPARIVSSSVSRRSPSAGSDPGRILSLSAMPSSFAAKRTP